MTVFGERVQMSARNDRAGFGDEQTGTGANEQPSGDRSVCEWALCGACGLDPLASRGSGDAAGPDLSLGRRRRLGPLLGQSQTASIGRMRCSGALGPRWLGVRAGSGDFSGALSHRRMRSGAEADPTRRPRTGTTETLAGYGKPAMLSVFKTRTSENERPSIPEGGPPEERSGRKTQGTFRDCTSTPESADRARSGPQPVAIAPYE